MMKEKSVYLICLSIFPFMICSGIIYSILSLYFQSLGAGKSQIGLLYTCGATSAAITAPFLGQLADKIGKKTVLQLSVILFALVFLGYSLSRNYQHLLFIQIGEGIAWAGLGASAVALIADVVPEERRGKAMGIYNTTWSLGWIVGPALGGFLSDQIGFRLTLVICAFVISAGLIMGSFLLPKR